MDCTLLGSSVCADRVCDDRRRGVFAAQEPTILAWTEPQGNKMRLVTLYRMNWFSAEVRGEAWVPYHGANDYALRAFVEGFA